ncbi:YlbE-like family protein [Halalkalibacter urbisdiaboli]|uniref:YlbE-like family protein n=1 Tax=Halalkalibacter urbisdiaboli TaxID=1960589 RepID=UPI000B448F17|nr:YlbE-like family protein [Halalkalibacter urbisdiaboli]
MRVEVQRFLEQKPELRQYIRLHPIWYRKLSRNPGELSNLEKEANYFYGRTLPQRVEKVQNNLGLVMMLMEMLQQTNFNQNEGSAH